MKRLASGLIGCVAAALLSIAPISVGANDADPLQLQRSRSGDASVRDMKDAPRLMWAWTHGWLVLNLSRTTLAYLDSCENLRTANDKVSEIKAKLDNPFLSASERAALNEALIRAEREARKALRDERAKNAEYSEAAHELFLAVALQVGSSDEALKYVWKVEKAAFVCRQRKWESETGIFSRELRR